MTTVLKILNRSTIDPIDGLFYWIGCGYGFEEYCGWDLPVPHRFVESPDPNYDYCIADGKIIEEINHCCPSCDRYLYSTKITCKLHHINPHSSLETLAVDNNWNIVQEPAMQSIISAGISGLKFSPIQYPEKPHCFWLMQPKHNVSSARIRYTLDCCGSCGSADVQCLACNHFYNYCSVCGNTFNFDHTDSREWCPLTLSDWNGDDAFGCDGDIIVTGECLEKLLNIGLFSFSFIACKVERGKIGTFPSAEARLETFIRHFDIP